MDDEGARRCAWCGAVAAPTATSCAGCGAALAQREDLGGVVIPGVTGLDPALEGHQDRPLRLPGASPTQGAASGVIAAAAIGGPVGLVALGGIAAMAAAEYAGASRGGSGAGDAAHVGELGELARQALERVERAEGDGEASAPAVAKADADGAPPPTSAGPPVADPWADLPERRASE